MDDIVSTSLSFLVWFYVFSCQPSIQQPMHPALRSTCFIFSFSSLFHTSLYDSGVEDSPWLSKGSQSVLYSYWWVWGIFVFRGAFGIRETKEGRTHTTANVSFFFLVCCCCALLTCYPKYSCFMSRESPSNTLVGSHGMGCNRSMWKLSFNCQLCPCSWSQPALQTGLPISTEMPAQFCRSSAPFYIVFVLCGTALNAAACLSFFSPFTACLLSFCSLFLPPYCSFICTPFVPCLKAVSNISVQGIHCATTS